MRKKIAVEMAPMGCLHDPLDCLAWRVYRTLTFGNRTVSVDEKGGVFVDDADLFDPQGRRSIIGTYDVFTLIPSIKDDLRRALRERANRWIVDWNAPFLAHANRPMHAAAVLPDRRRRRAGNVAASAIFSSP
jgi:hypothetical protein